MFVDLGPRMPLGCIDAGLVGEVQLPQAVMANHSKGVTSPRGRQAETDLTRFDEFELFEPTHQFRHLLRIEFQRAGNALQCAGLSEILAVVDLFESIFDQNSF